MSRCRSFWKTLALSFALGAAIVPGQAGAHGRRGGGGDLPDPLSVTNAKVELADGAYYMLEGRVELVAGGVNGRPQAVFVIDLDEYPWLGNPARVRNPSYPIEGSLSFWRNYEGQFVRLAFQAHGQVIQGRYVISLVPIEDRVRK